jgi:hypothetical protein
MQRESEVALYLKTLTLRDISDLDSIISDMSNNNTILIVRVTPLAEKSIDDLKSVIEEIYKYSKKMNGDIARLGEERLVIVPSNVKIWKNLHYNKE